MLIQGLIKTGKYSFRVFGGAIKHGSYQTVKVDPFGDDFIIAPVDGFGDPMKLRLALASEKPDALLLFTDPRFFVWVWELEDEIHDVCPIAYNHVWDEEPYPAFNAAFYESTDLINCISKKTYSLVYPNFPDKTNYVPHALFKEIYRILPRDEMRAYKAQILGEKYVNHFTALWVNRNARRKRPGDLLCAWKLFLDKIEEEKGHRNAALIMHTDPLDREGPNLNKVIELLNLEESVFLSKDKLDFEKMNMLYNISDTCINISHAEGFGLNTLEAMFCGLPIITTKTGGLTTQVENPETGEQYGVGIDPEVRSMVGSQLVPYIYEDYVSIETVAKAIHKLYSMSETERKALGLKAQEYAHKTFDYKQMIDTWDKTLQECIVNFKKKQNDPRYTLSVL